MSHDEGRKSHDHQTCANSDVCFLCESSRVFLHFYFTSLKLHVLTLTLQTGRWIQWKIWQWKRTKKDQVKTGEQEVTACAGGWRLDGGMWWFSPVRNKKGFFSFNWKPSSSMEHQWQWHHVVLFWLAHKTWRDSSSHSLFFFKSLFVLFLLFIQNVLAVVSSGLPCCIVGTVVSHQVSTTVALSSVKPSVTMVINTQVSGRNKK